ncbi:PLP-dependent aspartate aminotransferase family protein [Pedobacter sp. SYSU D00535]|uniref:trans-sulfuration enzyme family protein n=1 Tax=Pedobacter sp. SYSU D00535 TaxID=2810308 RepID=UPI001A96A2FB|nr:aminotransferase class I/II-fold pyridoxal phosphate-dependent enzyme [Pedobacter sp. SYSU D00535]
MKLETIAIHAGNKIDPTTKAVIQPLTLSTTFQRDEDGNYPGGFVYSRADNPNRQSLENVLAKLEGGFDACAFASGNAAGAALFQSLEPGSHVIAADDMYHGLKALINQVFPNILDVDYIDLSDLEAIKAAIKPHTTKLIWIETPSNPLLKVADIRAICEIASTHGIKVCCDNTFASPIFQRPLELGADFVMYSSTKYFGGHSDILGGAMIAAEASALWAQVRNIQSLSGAVPSPFDCYMTVRGIKTLPYRMRGHAANAREIALFLQRHPKVEKVFYPGLESHPLHNVAREQMSDFGGMLSFTLAEGEAAARKVANAMEIFTQATSLGGVESLLEHRASVEGPASKTPKNLLRLSVGLEAVDDLIDDLQQAIG